MISATDEKVSHISTKLITENSKNTLKVKDNIINEKLKMLQNKFIIVPKASDNVVFLYQTHYAQVLINEFGLNNVNSISSTQTKATKVVDKIVSQNK